MTPRTQSGFGALAAVVVLVLLALLAAAVVRLSSGAQQGIAQEVRAARAQAAMRAGVDWGLYQLLRGTWVGCAGGKTQDLDLRADHGVWVTVSCSLHGPFREGQDPATLLAVEKKVYELSVVACSAAAGPCPNAAAAITSSYVERARRLTVSPD
ncbi:MSHA biogenesis protein MshP [Inhella inkyongensis]|uniref:MSHA biogenesis protein MshP n=1 Tax=Inhella inkyongensis TaxID=392593 RepID=A0A840S840_9BURK|nr:MSHA biogenesis protein MshP [Inhella inkyongensis]MBB5204600.1 MSHA biogenesis protein MshP [Inhella inkyongensis]